jgi:hypothetical protein
MSFSEEINANFFQIDEMADEIIYNGTAIAAIISAPWSDTNDVDSQDYTILISEESITNPGYDDDVTINGLSYKVRGVRPDGTGLYNLKLERQ